MGSPVGVDVILAQHKPGEPGPRVVAYNSRTLTPVEQRYSYIERESLAIMYGCLKNQLYLLGSTFTVVTDHKLLASLYNNPRRPGPFRVERMRSKLQEFSFHVIGIPMGTNCAPLLADLFLYSYESEFLDNMIRSGHRKLATSFNLCY